MAHIEAKIIDGLIAHFGGVSLPAGVRVAYPNTAFKPDANPYIRLSIFKNDPRNDRLAFDTEPERRGIFQASVFWPEGKGIVKSTELAGQIADHFARGTRIDHDGISIWIIEEPSVGGDLQEDAWSQVPVSIPFHVYP